MKGDIDLVLRNHFHESSEIDHETALQILVPQLPRADKAAYDELVTQQEEASQMLDWRLDRERPQLTQQKYLEFYNQGVAEMKQKLIPRWLPTNKFAIEKSAREDAEAFVSSREQQCRELANTRWLQSRIALVESALLRDQENEAGAKQQALTEQFNKQQDFEI